MISDSTAQLPVSANESQHLNEPLRKRVVTMHLEIIPMMVLRIGPQNPTPTSTSVRAGNRLTRVSQLYYIPRYRIQLAASVWLTGKVVLGLPALGVVGFGVPCCCGVGGPRPGVSALLASWFVQWVSIRSREKRDLCGPQNLAHGVLKFPGTVLVVCRCKGSRVTWRLAVQFKMR